MKIEPEYCWFVGDTITELSGAKNTGFGAAIHYDSLGLYNNDQNFIRIHRLEDLLRLIHGDANVYACSHR
jgi:FMN phosphatase YigB (HAD superfamily)